MVYSTEEENKSRRRITRKLAQGNLPKDISVLKEESHHIQELVMVGISEAEKKPAGSISEIKGTFTITEDAQNLAVVLPVPSTLAILNPNLEEGWDQTMIRFEQTKNPIGKTRYSCYPQHYEVRYDHLFLYYDQLPKDAGCFASFKVMTTHLGKTITGPMKIREMYKTKVRGRSQ